MRLPSVLSRSYTFPSERSEDRSFLRSENRGKRRDAQPPVVVVKWYDTTRWLLERTGGRLVYRLLAWNPWQHVFLRGVDVLHTMPTWRHPLRC